MPATTIKFAHSITDTVTVTALGMQARIDALQQDIDGPMYRAVYWNDGCRYAVWVYGWEIEA